MHGSAETIGVQNIKEQNRNKFSMFVLLLAIFIQSITCLYSPRDAVISANQNNFKEIVLETQLPVLVEFFAPWCGHCKNLAPEYKKAAEKVGGLAKLVAVDCDAEQNKPLCGQFQIQGFPTIKMFSGGVKGLPEDYNGARTASALVDAIVKKVKSFVKKLDSSSYSSFVESKEIAKVILVSEKKDTPVMFKALSSEFYSRLDFGQISSSDKELITKVTVENFPSIVVYPKEGGDPLVYSGKLKFAPIKEFLDKYAKPLSSKKSKSNEKPKPKKEEPKPEPFDPKVIEIKDQNGLETECLSKNGVCVISFLSLDAEYPELVQDHEKHVSILTSLKKKFFDKKSPFIFLWVNALENGKQLIKDFDVSDMLPGLVAFNPNRKAYRLLRTAFEEESISSFLSDMWAGKGRNFQYEFAPLLNPEKKKKNKKQEEQHVDL